MTTTSDNDQWTHVGDGVYVTFDGYQLWLGANGPFKQIALDPGAFSGVVGYARRLNKKHDVRYFDVDYKEEPQDDSEDN